LFALADLEQTADFRVFLLSDAPNLPIFAAPQPDERQKHSKIGGLLKVRHGKHFGKPRWMASGANSVVYNGIRLAEWYKYYTKCLQKMLPIYFYQDLDSGWIFEYNIVYIGTTMIDMDKLHELAEAYAPTVMYCSNCIHAFHTQTVNGCSHITGDEGYALYIYMQQCATVKLKEILAQLHEPSEYALDMVANLYAERNYEAPADRFPQWKVAINVLNNMLEPCKDILVLQMINSVAYSLMREYDDTKFNV
jgi:hypothetical protein